MNTSNKLRIKVKSTERGYVLTVGKVKIVTMRRNMQDVYNSLLTRPFVESFARYATAKQRPEAAVYLNHYLAGYTVVVHDTQLTY